MRDEVLVFGAELRRLRLAADLSLTRMAALLHYSKGHLSKIETGRKQPHPDLVRRCDALLEAGGELVRLASSRFPIEPPPEVTRNDEVWQMNLNSNGTGSFQPVGRRQVLAAGAAPAFIFGTNSPAAAAEQAPLAAFRTLFDQFRQLGQATSSALVLPALIAQSNTVRGLAKQTRSGDERDLLLLAARYAEYAGWMAQEAGDDRAALWWTERAVEMAEAAGNDDLVTYAFVRRALITIYREDPQRTIELAGQAQCSATLPRIRGLAAQRIAQGHALAGDYNACMRGLDHARDQLNRANSDSEPVLGTTNLNDPAAMITGWCLYDLGRPAEASAVLDRECSRVPENALRTRARYGIRRALAHAASGNVDHACAITSQVLDAVTAVQSATVAADLRKLARLLTRFHRARSVHGLLPRLTAALSTHPS